MFDGRSHFLCGEPGWEEIADYSLTWAAKAAQTRRAPPPDVSVRSTSAACGMAGTVPGRVTATAAARLARSSAGSSSWPVGEGGRQHAEEAVAGAGGVDGVDEDAGDDVVARTGRRTPGPRPRA